MGRMLISDLKKGDSFNLITIDFDNRNKIVPDERVWSFLGNQGRVSFYTDGKKEYSTYCYRPVYFKP